QRVRRIAVVPGAHADAASLPGQDLVPQAHRALVRDQGEDVGAAGQRAVHHACSSGLRATSTASTKLDTTPRATVLPIARSTGIEDSASRPNTRAVVRLHTITACRVRSWSARSSPAWSKNSA